MRVPRQAPSKARLEIIPMIDVIFFLLVFFMLSTLAMTVNRALPVNLPTAAMSQQEVGENIDLTLTQDGALFFNREPIALSELGQRVKAARAAEAQRAVIIHADGQARHRAVVEVLDTLREAGVSRLAIAVKPAQKSSP
jgi:biopolymer transport protein ExbD